ncbi:MAG: YhfC family glutamic-type intramembrane protease [Eubacteriales bacterium]
MNNVPVNSIIGICFTLAVTVVLPVIIWILMAIKIKRVSSIIIAGMIGFVVPQLIIRIPVLQLLSMTEGFKTFYNEHYIAYHIILALTAGLFETTGRLFVLRLILHKNESFYTALGAGYGHGISEAILLVGMTYVNNLVISLMINIGTLSQFEGSDAVVSSLINTETGLFYAAGIERLLTIVFHISMTVLLAYFIYNKKTPVGFLICILIHTGVDFIVPLIYHISNNIYLSETAMLIVALIAAASIIILRPRFAKKEIQKDPAEEALEQGY